MKRHPAGYSMLVSLVLAVSTIWSERATAQPAAPAPPASAPPAAAPPPAAPPPAPAPPPAAPPPAPPKRPAAPAAPASPSAPAAAPKPQAPGAPAQPAKPSVPDAVGGIVRLERAGVLLGLGSVLAGDGRVLTALSPLGDGNHIDGRFADGRVVPLRVGYTDRAWDLALLTPQGAAAAVAGLRPSQQEALQHDELASYTLVGQRLVKARVTVQGPGTLLGADSTLLPGALVLNGRFRDVDVGAPIVDPQGDVVAVIAKACLPDKPPPCTRAAYGAPVSAIKAFLKHVPRQSAAPWIGISGVAAKDGPVAGVRVQRVDPRGPAAAAGVRGATTSGGSGGAESTADLIVAVNERAVTTPEALERELGALSVGDDAELLVYRAGKFRQVTVTLRAAPREPALERAAPQVPGPASRIQQSN